MNDKAKLKETLREERKIYLGESKWIPLPFREKDILFTIVYLLRKSEYHDTKKNKIRFYFFRLLYNYIAFKYSIHIPLHVCGKGLSLAHLGPIVIHEKCRIGENARIHVGVNIGANGGRPPQLGNCVYIGPGAKIFGDITIANGCKIGANAVVNKTCEMENALLVGIPAHLVVK